MILLLRQNRSGLAFLASATYLIGMLTSAVFGVYPYVLPARIAERGLSLYDAAAPRYGLRIGLYWWIPGILLAIGYFVFIYSRLPKTISVQDNDEH